MKIKFYWHPEWEWFVSRYDGRRIYISLNIGRIEIMIVLPKAGRK